jgi:DNA-binding winged helix-turn-helix (wHTH) protein
VEFQILGPTEVLDRRRRVPLPGGRGRALLALLMLHAGEPVSADRLIDELWGESPPPTARTVVHGLVSRLRAVLEPGRGKARPGALLQTSGIGYRLAIEPDAVDAHRFKRLIDEAGDAPAKVRAASSRRLWPSGGGRPSPTSRTSRSPSEPSPHWRSLGPRRSRIGSRQTSRRVVPQISCPNWNSSSGPIGSESGCTAC